FRIDDLPDLPGHLGELIGRRRVGRDVALGLPHRAGLRGDVEIWNVTRSSHDELRAAAADVDHERLVLHLPSARRAKEREPRLLLSRDRPYLDPIPRTQGSAKL